MRAPGRRQLQLLLIPASLAAACVSTPSSGARRVVPVDLNARPASHSAAGVAERSAPGAEIPLHESARHARMESLLAHRVPVLDLRPRGGGRFVLSIRGRPAAAGPREPLVVVDGVPYTHGGADVLAQLSPADVRRIEVLRDVASTSAYGYRGANGVVVVTTRRARN